jgi:RNA polymerase sigma-70 factor (ECF subfamily)
MDDDRALAARWLARRDEDAFRELYRRHTPVLYLMARRLLGSRGGADDAVQDAWLRAARGISAFAWTSTLRTWLCGILINCCRESLRRSRRADAPAPPLPLGTGWTPRTLAIERAIGALPDGQREVLVLHDVYGHTHDEIAAMLDIAAGTSKSQLHDARRAVRQALSPDRAQVMTHERG